MTQHARDYLAARQWLDHYFALPKSVRSEWLNGGSEGARIVLAYFKRYGKFSRMERDFKRLSPALLDTQNDLLAARLKFWKRYFELTPDQRPRFVMNHAEEAGVFVYGILSARERHERENRWMQQAFLTTGSQRAAHYLYVRPLLDYFFSLKDKRDKQLFLRANPEVSEYLDRYSRKSVTGDKRLDKLVESYFKLPSGSLERSAFLRDHPEVQDYFDERSTPAERAMHKLLESYFDLPVGLHREQFLAKHPEVSAYFEKRARERDFLTLQYGAFDEADPRLSTFRDLAARDIGESAEKMRYRLAFDSVEGTSLTANRERRPLT